MKKNKNGGMVQKFKTCLNRYNPLNHPRGHDCGANCFFLLNYSDFDTSMYLAKNTLTGLSDTSMLNIYNKSYEDSAEWINITRFNVDEIEKVLPSTYATIIFVIIRHPQYTVHYDVLLNYNGNFFVLDPQSRDSSCSPKDFDEYRNYHQIEFINMFKSKPTKDKNKVTKEIIDEVLSEENELYETKLMSQEDIDISSSKRSRDSEYDSFEDESGSAKKRR
jgi:hypothetical protein